MPLNLEEILALPDIGQKINYLKKGRKTELPDRCKLWDDWNPERHEIMVDGKMEITTLEGATQNVSQGPAAAIIPIKQLQLICTELILDTVNCFQKKIAVVFAVLIHRHTFIG